MLSKVLQYCTFHVEAEAKDDDDKQKKSEEEIKSFDNEYMKVDQSTLYDLILVPSVMSHFFSVDAVGMCRLRIT